VQFPDVFEELSFESCRPSHAEDALRRPRAIDAHEVGGTTVVLATKLVDPGKGPPFVVLVIAQQRGGTYSVFGGLRLYAGDAAVELADDPTATFAELIDRYGLRYQAGGVTSKFSALLIEPPLAPGGSPQFLAGVEQTERMALNAFIKPTRDHVEIAWPFVLDGERYLADVRAARAG